MIDLHLHTSHSDGTDSVEELLRKADEKSLEIISITDHDSVDAYFELEINPTIRNAYTGKIIVGSEIKCTFEGENIELLAYGIDYKKIKIKSINRELIQKDILTHLVKTAIELGFRVDENIHIDSKDPKKFFASCVFCDEVLRYKENESLIKKYGSIDRLIFYKDHECNKKSPFYFNSSHYFDDCETLIEKIHEAGGLAFLAHGLNYSFDDNRKTVEKILKTTKIDGLECIHPTFDKDDIDFMISLCKRCDKFVSGGSDYHAQNKPTVSMGTGIDNNMRVDEDVIEDWIDKVEVI